jgi:hypothetical protein
LSFCTFSFGHCVVCSKRGKKARHDITEILLKVALNAMNKPDQKGREMKILTFFFFRSWRLTPLSAIFQ